MKRGASSPALLVVGLGALVFWGRGLGAQDLGPWKKARFRIPVRVVDSHGKPLEKATVFFVRQAMSGSRVKHDDRYGYELLRFPADARGRFKVRLPPGGNLSVYALAEREGKRFASRLENDVFGGKVLKLTVQEDPRRSLVIEGLAPWRERFGPRLFLEVYANSSVNGLVPGPSSPHFRSPLQPPKGTPPFPDRVEVPLPPLPRESLWVALLDSGGGYLESLFLGRARSPSLGPLRFGTPKLCAFRLQDKTGAPFPGTRVLVRAGTPIVTAERRLRTDAQGRVEIPHGLGKRSIVPFQDEMNPIALFLPEDCRVLYRPVQLPKRAKTKKEPVPPEGSTPIPVIATKVKGAKAFRLSPKAFGQGRRLLQYVGAVSETGFVREQIVPVPSEAISEGKPFRLPLSGNHPGPWNGLILLEGGQIFPVLPGGTSGLLSPQVRCLLTLRRPGKERAFGGRVALAMETEEGAFFFPYSADSQGRVFLALPRSKFPILAFEPGIGLRQEMLDLTAAPAHFEKKIVLEPFYEVILRIREVNGGPVEGALCRWSASGEEPPVIGKESVPLPYAILGQQLRGRARSDGRGRIRLFFYPEIRRVAFLFRARVGGKALTGTAILYTLDDVHDLEIVLK